MKVATVVGTRPEIIRLCRVIAALERYTDHTLIHTGQNYDYELNQVFFEDLTLSAPDYYLEAAGATAAATIGAIIGRTDEVFRRVRPDAVLILGDTNSCLAAISAKRLKIPVFHMEAGNRCFDQRVPEEINRRIVDHISDVNLPYSEISREYLVAEGIPPERIIKTGSPMYEVLHHYMDRIVSSDVIRRLQLADENYFLVSCHREENVDEADRLRRLVHVLNTLAQTFGIPVVVSTHPRTRARLDSLGASLDGCVQLLPPQSFSDYVHLEIHSRATLSDSGTISEESAILNFPAINLRETHERPEAFEEASVMFTGLSITRVTEALRILASQPRGGQRLLNVVADYNVPNVSEKIVRIIQSYVDYVNRVVWQKPVGVES